MLSVHLSMMQSHDEHVSTWLHYFYPFGYLSLLSWINNHRFQRCPLPCPFRRHTWFSPRLGLATHHGVDVHSQLYRWLTPSYQCQIGVKTPMLFPLGSGWICRRLLHWSFCGRPSSSFMCSPIHLNIILPTNTIECNSIGFSRM